ncbi:MAG: ATP-dependent Clp protease adaptor ClpS [Phycisphaerales bacterium]|nr:ATP-dependent Clp protease adaptor ClpS [Phycisphaerales bacterium]
MSQTIELPAETLARPSQTMPQWAVRLHNDNKNDMVFVVTALIQLVRLPAKDATERTLEAHNRGSAIVFQTHREHAELIQDQLQSKGLSATIEKN